MGDKCLGCGHGQASILGNKRKGTWPGVGFQGER